MSKDGRDQLRIALPVFKSLMSESSNLKTFNPYITISSSDFGSASGRF